MVTGISGALVLALLVGAYLYFRPLLRTATGYAAHNQCALMALSGRASEDTLKDLPPHPLMGSLRTGEGSGYSRAWVGGIFAQQTAWETEFGCVVADEPPDLPAAAGVPGTSPLLQDTAIDPSLDEAIGIAFGDGLDADARAALGTRAVIVVRDGVVVGERYADGFTAETRQRGWSVTKSVANLYIGALVADGVLSLDEDHLVSEWTDERAEITVDQLLRMTSGLAWDESSGRDSPVSRMLFEEPDMGAFVARQELTHKPGTHQEYSSGSTTLLCYIAGERMRGAANDIRTRLFAPLGLTSAVLESDATGTPMCGTSLWATPRDFARVGQFALDDGVVAGKRLLPEGWMAQATQPKPVESTEIPGYAASWWANGALDMPKVPGGSFSARGNDGQRVLVVPSEGLVVVRMGFTPGDEDLKLEQLVKAATG